MRLLQPQHTMEILDQSSSIVGISVMSSQAAAAGPATFLTFAALISFSLGFMNLLPIPPLDGGKLVIEIIQKVAGRELPLKVQTIVSEQFDVAKDTITMDTNIADDLGADSLDVVDMLMSLEDEFNVEIPDEEIENIHTVGEVVAYIEEHM